MDMCESLLACVQIIFIFGRTIIRWIHMMRLCILVSLIILGSAHILRNTNHYILSLLLIRWNICLYIGKLSLLELIIIFRQVWVIQRLRLWIVKFGVNAYYHRVIILVASHHLRWHYVLSLRIISWI